MTIDKIITEESTEETIIENQSIEIGVAGMPIETEKLKRGLFAR